MFLLNDEKGTFERMLTHKVLGVSAGDDVVFETRVQIIWRRIDGATVYLGGQWRYLQPMGNCYRKDALPGKRQEYVVLSVENNVA